ncbi:unnamed protein product, partial [Rotaria sp. Silwood1]
MAEQTNDSIDTGDLATNGDLKEESYELFPALNWPDYKMNENDLSSSEDEDGKDNEISHHHKEAKALKNKDWPTFPNFVSSLKDQLTNRFSHGEAINALENFLNTYIPDHLILGMSFDTILQLVRLVLENQYFVYKCKMYQQIRGSASGSPLTIPLVYIYLFYTDQIIMNDLIDKNELFVRYRDEAFITWNHSEQQLSSLFSIAKSRFPEVKWHISSIDYPIHFVDIKVGHNTGRLFTGVYHQEMFYNDFLSSELNQLQHPNENIWNWLRKALLKAVRYCCDTVMFHSEIGEIQRELLRRGHSEQIFDEALDAFYEDFGVTVIYPPFLTVNYEKLRKHISIYDKNRAAAKKERSENGSQQQEIPFHLPHGTDWDDTTIAEREHELNKQLHKHLANHPTLKDFR